MIDLLNGFPEVFFQQRAHICEASELLKHTETLATECNKVASAAASQFCET